MDKPKYTAAELFAAQALASQAKKELTENILPYWLQKTCKGDTGFHGRISGEEIIDP